MDVPDSILELASQAGPWGWAVVALAGILWLPNIALVAASASGRRVPVAAFLAVVGLLVGVGCVATLYHSMVAVTLADASPPDAKVLVVGAAQRTGLVVLVLVGRLGPALATVAALSMAAGVWMRAPETRFWAARQAIGPGVLAGMGAVVALAVDPRLALAGVGGALAVSLVSAADDASPDERRELAGRRVAVGCLVVTAMAIAVLAPAAAAVARGDGALGLVPWPLASDVAFYSASTVLQRYGVLPSALAPLGLVGLSALWSVLPVSARLGGTRSWAGAISALGVLLISGIPALAASWTHQSAWESQLPPTTQVAVPRVGQVLEARVQRRLTWTPSGVDDRGAPLTLQIGKGAPGLPPGADPAVWHHVEQDYRLRPIGADRSIQRRIPWDVEIPSVTRVGDALPMLRAIAADPDIGAGLDVVVVGSDGFPGTIAVGLVVDGAPASGAVRLPLSPQRSWGDVVEQAARLRRRGEAVNLVLPALD